MSIDLPLNASTVRMLLIGTTLVLLAEGAAGQQAPDPTATRPMVRAVRLQPGESLILDGALDEPVWQRASPATDFVQQDPANGARATERTEVRILFDRHSLYLGVICFDSEPDLLLGNQMQRDQPFSADDRFMWVIDSYLDGRSGYFFEINPSGAMGDGLVGVTGRSQVNKQWDGIWIARVRRADLSWTAEIEIPFRTVNFDPAASAWGINFQRTVRRKNEESLWNGWARNQGLFRMSNTGRLVGISDVSQGIGLDLKPYGVANLSQAPGRGEPALRGSADAGVDLFYNLTPGLRANLTVNTDFAETEVDQRRVNLTRFPLFFPEKRDFFLEGSSFFDFSREPGNAVVPFFSRRVGLDGQGNPQRIDAGVKLTGQLGRQDLGLLQVRTGQSGEIPGEDFTVFRIKRRVLTQSYLGAIYTRRDERGTASPNRQSIGVDFQLATSRFRGSQNLEFSGFYLWTSNPLGTGESSAYGVRLNYPNDLWNWRVSFRELQQHYDPAVGFTGRRNYRRVNPVIRLSPRPASLPAVRRLSFEMHLDLMADLSNRIVTRKWDLTVFQVDFHSGDQLQVHVIPDFERLERNFDIHPGITLPADTGYSFIRYRIEAQTASHRPLALRSNLELGTFYSGDRREVTLGVTLRPRPGMRLNLEGEWNKVALAEGRFRAHLYRGEVATQFSPWISLANLVQYDSISRIVGWQSRFRWILRPGNDIYAVYTHNWQDDEGGVLTLDRRLATKLVYTYRF